MVTVIAIGTFFPAIIVGMVVFAPFKEETPGILRWTVTLFFVLMFWALFYYFASRGVI